MFIGKSLGNPDDRCGVEARRVGQQLPQMIVVGLLELIFDEHPGVGGGVAAQDVRAKRPDVLFRRLQHQFNPQRVRQAAQILWMS